MLVLQPYFARIAALPPCDRMAMRIDEARELFSPKDVFEERQRLRYMGAVARIDDHSAGARMQHDVVGREQPRSMT